MINSGVSNLIYEAKETVKDSLAKLVQQINTDYFASGASFGVVSYFVSPFLMTVPLAALAIQAENTQPFIIGSAVGYVSGAVFSNIVCNAAVAMFITNPLTVTAAAVTGYVIYNAERGEEDSSLVGAVASHPSI